MNDKLKLLEEVLIPVSEVMPTIRYLNDKIEVQFWGWALILKQDGTWYTTDTAD
jgi:hypothetical protein